MGWLRERAPAKNPSLVIPSRAKDSIFSIEFTKRVLITSVIRKGRARLKLPYVLIDYSKCAGSGDCVKSCPASAFELAQERCKPIDHFVKNPIALQYFRERLVGHGPIPFAIRYHVPECFLCWQCIGACPKHAIDVEYDDLDIREFLLPVENPVIPSSRKRT